MPLQFDGGLEEKDMNAVMTAASIDGGKVYKFDPKSGILQVSMSKGDITAYLESLGFPKGRIPEGGIELILPTIPLAQYPSRFTPVKKVESMPGVKKGEYALRFGQAEP